MKWNFRVGGMGKNSFRDVVKALFYYEIYKDLSFYIEENPSKLDCRCSESND